MLHHSFDFIAISETWINGPPLIPFSLDGYTMLNADRSHGRGGGVALFVKTGFIYNLRTDIVESLDSDINCEYLFIDFVDQFQKKNTVGVMYRKPGSSVTHFFDFYNDIVRKLTSEHRNNLYILGILISIFLKMKIM